MDVMKGRVLADGTIKTWTDEVSPENHQAAEEFFRLLAATTGGEEVRERRGDADHHHHHHYHGHVHTHDHGHSH